MVAACRATLMGAACRTAPQRFATGAVDSAALTSM